MASDNPYIDDDYSTPPPATAPRPPISDVPEVDPYDPTAHIPETPARPSTTVRASDNPYSIYNTAGRMATDALFGIPDTITALNRGLHWGFNKGLDYLTGATPPAGNLSGQITGDKPPEPGTSVPYIAPIARKYLGVAELPADASMGRILGEGVGSAVVGGLGSAATRGVIRGARAVPGIVESLNPWATIRKVSEDKLRDEGKFFYNALDNLDVRYHQQTPPRMADAIEQYVFKPKGISSVNAKNAVNDVQGLRTIDPSLNAPPGVVRDYVGPRDIEGVRQNLNATRSAPFNPNYPREGQAANQAIGAIDRFIDNPPASAMHPSNVNDPLLVGDVLRQARGNTAAAERLSYLTGTAEDIATKLGSNPQSRKTTAQAMRDRAASALIASREGKGPLQGYSPFEKQLLENVSEGTRFNQALRALGQNAPTTLTGALMQSGGLGWGGQLLNLSPKTSAVIAGAIPAAEWGAKKLANWGTRRAYQQAMDAIAARSPYAQSIGIAAPQTARQATAPLVSRGDIAAGLLAPHVQQRLYVSPGSD